MMNDKRIQDGAGRSKDPRAMFPFVRRTTFMGVGLVALLVLVALLASSCGSNKKSQGNNGGAGGLSAQGGSSAAPSDPGAQMAKFAGCMRKNGVPNFPDPQMSGGNVQMTIPNGVDPNSPAFKKASQACRSFAPTQAGGPQPGGTPNPAAQKQMLKFVTCMRKNGVPKFPDPTSGGNVMLGAGVDPNSPAFHSAMQRCNSLLSAGAGAGG